jgi:hypothetical protein
LWSSSPLERNRQRSNRVGTEGPRLALAFNTVFVAAFTRISFCQMAQLIWPELAARPLRELLAS